MRSSVPNPNVKPPRCANPKCADPMFRATPEKKAHRLPCGHNVCRACFSEMVSRIPELKRDLADLMRGDRDGMKDGGAKDVVMDGSGRDERAIAVEKAGDAFYHFFVSADRERAVPVTSAFGVICPLCRQSEDLERVFTPVDAEQRIGNMNARNLVTAMFPVNEPVMQIAETFEPFKDVSKGMSPGHKRNEDYLAARSAEERVHVSMEKADALLTEYDAMIDVRREELTDVYEEVFRLIEEKKEEANRTFDELNARYGKPMAEFEVKLRNFLRNCDEIIGSVLMLLSSDKSTDELEPLAEALKERAENLLKEGDDAIFTKPVPICEVVDWDRGAFTDFNEMLKNIGSLIPVPMPRLTVPPEKIEKFKFTVEWPEKTVEDIMAAKPGWLKIDRIQMILTAERKIEDDSRDSYIPKGDVPMTKSSHEFTALFSKSWYQVRAHIKISCSLLVKYMRRSFNYEGPECVPIWVHTKGERVERGSYF